MNSMHILHSQAMTAELDRAARERAALRAPREPATRRETSVRRARSLRPSAAISGALIVVALLSVPVAGITIGATSTGVQVGGHVQPAPRPGPPLLIAGRPARRV